MTIEIRTLGDDEKITEPGFYNITLDRHHSQPCDGVSVTSGVLRRMDPDIGDPAEVWATHKLNPDPWPSKDTPALRLGRAMAAMVEGGVDELRKHFVVIDADSPRKPTAAQIAKYDAGDPTPAGKKSVEFWRSIEADGRDVLTADQTEMILGMAKALVMDPAATAALDGLPEITMAAFDEETNLWFLARPDLVDPVGLISDYKKINTQGRQFNRRVCNNRITQHGYDMQMAFACEVFEHLAGFWPTQVGLVFQKDAVPYSCITMGITEDDLRIAQWRNRRSARLFRKCLDSGHWPGPDAEEVGDYVRPEWQQERLIEEMEKDH